MKQSYILQLEWRFVLVLISISSFIFFVVAGSKFKFFSEDAWRILQEVRELDGKKYNTLTFSLKILPFCTSFITFRTSLCQTNCMVREKLLLGKRRARYMQGARGSATAQNGATITSLCSHQSLIQDDCDGDRFRCVRVCILFGPLQITHRFNVTD